MEPYAFEDFLKRAFDLFGLQTREPFRNVGEQIDGSFLLDDQIYLLEAKWTRDPIGVADLHAFHGKLEKAAWTRGLFVSYGGFTNDGLTAFGAAKRLICMEGRDIYDALEKQISPTKRPFIGSEQPAGTCRSFIRPNRLPGDLGKPELLSNFGPFGQRQCIVDIYTEVSDGIFDVGMAEQDLHGAKITRCLVDQCRLGPSHRVCAIFSFVEADRRYPFVDKASILSCAQVTKVIDPAGEHEVTDCAAAPVEPSLEALACLSHDFELHGSIGLLLDDGRVASVNVV